MIDYQHVREFWRKRADLETVRPESLVNFVTDEAALAEKIRIESDVILAALALTPDMRVLDAGAGTGQWALRMAPLAKNVTAVDYEEKLLARGRLEAQRTGSDNIEFVCAAIESYEPAGIFQRIFFSGILMYLEDALVASLLPRLYAHLAPNGAVVLREPTSILSARHVISQKYSPALDAAYSAIYRTGAEFCHIFARAGFKLRETRQIFAEGSSHNKFPETRLCLHVFVKVD